MIISLLFLSLFIKYIYGFTAVNSFSTTLKSLKLTPNQQIFYNYLQDDETSIVICHGISGTGKSYLSTLYALNELKSKRKDKIILTRPTVLIDSTDFGALPGNINDKMTPYMQHICYIIGSEPNNSSNLYNIVKENKIEVIPLEYMRGHTFKDLVVIADEMQNSTNRQMKALLTRIGTGSKVIVLGDQEQSDLDNHEENGLINFINKYKNYSKNNKANFVKIVKFTEEDIKRSDIVKEVLKIYE